MKLNRIIIHELVKESGVLDVDYIPSQQLLTVNEGLASMILDVHESFEKSISSYHRFRNDCNEKPIFINAHKYVNIDETDDRFYKWSKTGMRELSSLIKNVSFATGGYYIFSDYEINNNRFLSIVIVRNKEAFNIKWDPKKELYSVDTTENINIEQMAMGFRLNVNLYKSGSNRNFIAIINKRGDEVSQYFKDWVCIDDGTGPKQNTNNFIQIIKDLGLPMDFEGDEDDFLKYVYEGIHAEYKGNNGYVNVDRISQLFYKDPTYLRRYASEECNLELDSEFKIYTASLKKLIRYKAAVKGISLSLDIDHFQNETVILRDNSVIIKNQSIYDQLLKQRNEEN